MQTKRERLQQFYVNPFGFIDSLNVTFHGNNLNIFQKHVRVRKVAFAVALFSLLAWVTLGFDSAILQFYYPVETLGIGILHGNIPTFDQLHARYDWAYGKEMHWSAFVIYGLMFWFLSKHFHSCGIEKSKNLAYTFACCFFAISVFEFFWMGSYSYFQNQPWVATFMMPQLRIIMQNIGFFSVGVIGIFYMWVDSFILKGKEIVRRTYCFNWNWKALLLIVASITLAVLWWLYPFHVDFITVKTTVGLWTNSNHFPQTLYTIDVNPLDSVNAGIWFYVGNNWVHALNTLVKAVWAFTIVYIAKIRKVISF